MITTTAHLTFVALDENKRPTDVPKILPETDNEKRRYENAKIRVGHRKELLNKLKQQNS
jgi:acyl-CoA hydrolase